MTQYIENSQEIIRKILIDCWSLYITNAVVLIPSQDFEIVHLFTYFPYTSEYCEHVEPVEYDHFKNGTFATNKNIFPNKFQNFYKCKLIVQSLNLPSSLNRKQSNKKYMRGIKGTIFYAMEKYFNFTLVPHNSKMTTVI